MSRNSFNAIGGLKPRRNVFDLTYRTNFTCDMGQLIPVMFDEVVPGDHFTIGSDVIVRFQPMSAPIMHELTATVHYFFIPYRILWDRWEEFIEQGEFGGENSLAITIPRFQVDKASTPINETLGLGTLWDYFGMPVQMNDPSDNTNMYRFMPIDMPWRAYARVWNEYYRDVDLQAEVDDGTDVPGVVSHINNHVLRRNWKKDYFTAARPFRQAGIAPALPVNIDMAFNMDSTTSIDRWSLARFHDSLSGDAPAGGNLGISVGSDLTLGSSYSQRLINQTMPATQSQQDLRVDSREVAYGIGKNAYLKANATSFDVSDLRLAFQTQKWLERNARAGVRDRYTSFLRAHFGVSPTDERLQRPEYIGGVKVPINVSEILQTSQTTTQGANNPSAQGTMSGHGLAADGSLAGKIFIPEFGMILGLFSVMPKPAYQNGINRQWLRELPIDFYFPEFCRLSEQGIYQAEIQWGHGVRPDTADGVPYDRGIFGYTGQYDEMRTKHDIVANEMRQTRSDPPGMNLSYWNLARSMVTESANSPKWQLNSEFITCNPDKRIFAVPTVPGLIVNVTNRIRAARPMPAIADPGLVDHY